MMIYGNDREIAAWVGDQLDIDEFGPCSAIGMGKGGKIVAGVVYSRYSGTNIEMTIASITPKWASKVALQAFFGYPFNQLDLGRVTAVTRKGNQHTIAFLQRLGFQREGVLREAFGDDDAIVFGLLKRECRFISNGKIKQSTSPARSGEDSSGASLS